MSNQNIHHYKIILDVKNKTPHLLFTMTSVYHDIHELQVEERNEEYQIFKKKIPFGIDDFAKLRKLNGYYVDKTRMIEEVCESIAEVTLITRPRRFGKTLNMSMLAEFFDITKKDTHLFDDTYIARTRYMVQMHQFPVIFLTFKDCRGSMDNVLDAIYFSLHEAIRKHEHLLSKIEDEELKADIKTMYQKTKTLSKNTMDFLLISKSILKLSEVLNMLYQKPVLLFIDEYDKPFMEAYGNNYYSEIKDFLSGMLSRALKGNPYLHKAVLTGVQRIAKENIFSGLNHLEVCSLQDEQYADCFGFTEAECIRLLSYYDKDLNEDVKNMYDGYRIGNNEIYNPWSILNYVKKGKLIFYWINTGNHLMIKEMLERADQSFFDQVETLLNNKTVNVMCNLEECYYENQRSSQIWAQLINAGYLTINKILENNYFEIRIVNKEVLGEFISLIHQHFGLDDSMMREIATALMEGNIEKFRTTYTSYLVKQTSYFNLRNENSYHLIMLTLCSSMSRNYEILSNKETGKGRSDIYLKSRNTNKDIMMEFKYANKKQYQQDKDCLNKLAKKALAQIDQQDYACGKAAIKIGLAHHAKNCVILWKEDEAMKS